MATVTVELHSGIEGLQQLREPWQQVLAGMPQRRYYHSWEWWRAAVPTLLPEPATALFFLLRSNGEPVAVIPTQYRTRTWFGLPRRELGFPCHPHLPLQDILCRADEDAGALLLQWQRAVREEFGLRIDVLDFGQAPGDSVIAGALAGAMVERRAAPPCNLLSCEVPFEQMLAGFSNNFRANLRKANNRWSKAEQPSCVSAEEGQALERAFEDFLRIEASGWKGKMGTAIALDPCLRAFYQSLLTQLAPQRRVRITCLATAGEAIAAVFCVMDADTLHLLKIAYDEDWGRYSPGTLLLERVLRECAESGRVRTISLVTDAAWHREWKPLPTPVLDLRRYQATPLGYLGWYETRLRRQLRGPVRRLTQWAVAPARARLKAEGG